YAQLLFSMGASKIAYPYLAEALALSPLVPYLKVLRAWTGIPLALQHDDQDALAKCSGRKTIEVAFRSAMPDLISGTSSAFAHLYASKGRLNSARNLLHRALEPMRYAHFNLDLLLAIGQFGMFSDIPRARELLDARAALPNAAVFKGGLALFDAFVAKRQG